MLDYLPIVWVAIFVLSVISEAASHAFIPLWFAPAAAISLILSFFELAAWVEVLAFFFISLVLLLLSRTAFASLLGVKKHRETAIVKKQELVGRQVLVIEDVDNLRMRGKIRVGGVEFPAVSYSDDIVIPAGEIVTIAAYENGVVVCE